MVAPVTRPEGAPLLRAEFALDVGHGDVVSAVLHLSAHGIVEATVNGRPASDELFTPGWTSYSYRLRYVSHEVSHLVTQRTVIGLSLGNGWWRGRLGWSGDRAVYGDRLAALAHLEIRFADGHVQALGTDESWLSAGSEVVADDLYDGQTVDFRRRDDSWQRTGADLSSWSPVEVVEADLSTLVPCSAPPVRRQETLRPQRIWHAPSGAILLDFGQNLVGFLRFRVTGERGSEVLLRHAEVLEDGEIGVRPLRTALATDRLVLSGDEDHFEPTKTFHGFRYAEVTGWPGELVTDDVEAVVVHTDMQRTGWFACSDPALDQLHSNVVWGWKGNAVDVPTDCPQRDERLGWTGDLAVFAPTAAFLYDSKAFLQDWLRDLAAEQAAHGVVPFVVPDVLGDLARAAAPELLDGKGGFVNAPTAIWGDAAVWVPWALWEAYGDLDVLAEHFTSMADHVRSVRRRVSGSGLWDTGFQFGDWLDPTAPPENPLEARAGSGVVATACLFRSARTVSRAASLLGQHEAAAEFAELAERTRLAFVEHYVDAAGRIRSDCPTVYALAVVFGLLDAEAEQQAGDRLAELVAAAEHTILTGFAGTPYVTNALTRTGHVDAAYALLMNRSCPGWLYQVDMGATTIWERWDSMLPDGSINPGEMTSFNHYAFGSIADWMHRTVGGLAPLEPGYRRALVAPRPGGGLTWARTSLQTAHGTVSVAWEIDGEQMVVDVELPAGVDALLDLVGCAPRSLEPGRHRVAVPAGAA